MSTYWPKILVSITVPTGGWSLVFVDAVGTKTATIPAATYDSFLSLATALRTAIRALSGHSADKVEVSSTGYTRITIAGLVSITWASCTAGLKTTFGLAGVEAVISNAITSTYAHRWGWYPGVATLSITDGIGISSDSMWWPEDGCIRTVAGSGLQTIVAPSRFRYTRSITFSGVGRAEVRDRYRGVAMLADKMASGMVLYLDRSVGDVGSYGTEGDPGDEGDDDTSVDWYNFSLNSPPMKSESSQSADFFEITLSMNGDPD